MGVSRRQYGDCLHCRQELFSIKPGDNVTYISGGRGYAYSATVEEIRVSSYCARNNKWFAMGWMTLVFIDGHGTRIRLTNRGLWSQWGGGGVLLEHERQHWFTPA